MSEFSIDQGGGYAGSAFMRALGRIIELIVQAATAAANEELSDTLLDRADAIAHEWHIHPDTYRACFEEASRRLQSTA